MNITFTSEELGDYSSKLNEWYSKRSESVMLSMVEWMRGGHVDGFSQRWHSLLKEYEEKNPRPDWRSLL